MSEKRRQILVARFDKNSAEEIMIHLCEWKGQQYVDIRTWYKPGPGEDKGLHPSTKGIRFSAELLPDLRSAIDAAISAVENGPGIEIVQDGAQGAGEKGS
jgi:hypothetical protein